MPKFTLHQYHVDRILDLVNDEIKSIGRGDSSYGNKDDNDTALEDLTVIRALLTDPKNS